ncbi:MAG: uroporphyrinogen decarboxylase family protein [Phycisphaerales bacterium]
MSDRKRFIEYVKKGGEKPFVSLQIGAGAGFDCKLAGKEWISEGTLDDTIRAYEMVGCEPLFNLGLPDLGQVIEELKWQENFENTKELRITYKYLETPFGQISIQLNEQKKHGVTPVKYALTADSINVFDIVNWYAEQHARVVKYLPDLLQPLLAKAHLYGPVSVQWNVQPFELLGLLSVDNLAMLAMLESNHYRCTCDLIRDINIEMVKAVFACGADFVFLGSSGAEMLSPQLYEEFIIPDSQLISKAAHNAGGLIYSHICSPVEPFLSRGFYNRMGIDLFETLSPPPVGNVDDLRKARQILSPGICTRGNIGLDILLNGTLEQIEEQTLKILDATNGYKHMIAASDYLFYDIPLENVKTVVSTVDSFLSPKF